MAHAIHETRVVRETSEPEVGTVGRSSAARIVSIITDVLLGVLTLRFILVLLGANSTNGFVNFIYSISYPFVAPFAGIFNYSVNYGVSRFEFETLIAMAVYGFIAWIILRLVSRQPVDTVE